MLSLTVLISPKPLYQGWNVTYQSENCKCLTYINLFVLKTFDSDTNFTIFTATHSQCVFLFCTRSKLSRLDNINIFKHVGAYPGFHGRKWLINKEYFYSPWLGCYYIGGLPPAVSSPVPFVHLGEERHCDSKVSCPRTQRCAWRLELEPRPFNLESSAKTIRPRRLPMSSVFTFK